MNNNQAGGRANNSSGWGIGRVIKVMCMVHGPEVCEVRGTRFQGWDTPDPIFTRSLHIAYFVGTAYFGDFRSKNAILSRFHPIYIINSSTPFLSLCIDITALTA